MYFTLWRYDPSKNCSARVLLVNLLDRSFLCLRVVCNICSATYAFFYSDKARASRLYCASLGGYLRIVFIDVGCTQDHISGKLSNTRKRTSAILCPKWLMSLLDHFTSSWVLTVDWMQAAFIATAHPVHAHGRRSVLTRSGPVSLSKTLVFVFQNRIGEYLVPCLIVLCYKKSFSFK